MRKLFFLAILVYGLSSCKEKKEIPGDILPKEKMQQVLWSMITAGEFLNGYALTKDSIDKGLVSSKIYGQVFQIHHISKEDFDKSYAYYQQHPGLMKTILDSLARKQTITPGIMQKKEDSMRRRFVKDSTLK